MTHTHSAGWIRVTEENHAWNECTKTDGHCHCSNDIAAIRANEVRTCRHCGTVSEPLAH